MTISIPKFQTLLVAISGRRVDITLNRPDKLNAINKAMVTELHALMDVLEDEADHSVLVFQGAGEKAFVAGADIAELKARKSPEALEAINARLFDRIARFPFATVAKIRGFCFGGGMELSLACDIRIGSTDSLFAQPEVGLGILPGAGATFRLPKIVGRGLAREMIFSGLRIDAQRALDAGLLNHVVEPAKLDEVTATIVDRILKQGPEAVAAAKRVMSRDENAADSTAAVFAQAALFESADKMKRMEDFLSKAKEGKK
ncbi:MAG: enoyl-CoA hydratase/isomerase family protein [Planctomycetota bacterium]